MSHTIIKNARIINEKQDFHGDVYIRNERIEKIDTMDMPNTMPNVLTQEILEEKYARATQRSFGNFSFFMGLNHDNLEEALTISTEDVCGLTDDGLYFDKTNSLLCNSPEYLEKLFSRSEHLVALHSEDESIINANFLISLLVYLCIIF